MKFIEMVGHLKPIKALAIGDFMQDVYTHGKVDRISPEAPVPIFQVHSEASRPGGAGNVALNLCSLGAQVKVVGRVGCDFAGEQMHATLEQEGIDTCGLIHQKSYKTPVKNRFIADSQQVLRVDFETLEALPDELQRQVVDDGLADWLEDCQIIAISDYGKGFLTDALLRAIIERANARRIPVIVDPKGIDFARYRGASVLKPNRLEAYAAARLQCDASLDEVARVILQTCGVEQLVVTRSHEGISLFDHHGSRLDFPVRSREVKDVTGAGDTVLSVLSVALASGLAIACAVQLANLAASMAIERVGCVRLDLADMAERAMELDGAGREALYQ